MKGGFMKKGQSIKKQVLISWFWPPMAFALFALFLLLISGNSDAADDLLKQSSMGKDTTTLPNKTKVPVVNSKVATTEVDSPLSKQAAIPKPAINKVKKNKKERFTPTEAISEDLAVSFPTDI